MTRYRTEDKDRRFFDPILQKLANNAALASSARASGPTRRENIRSLQAKAGASGAKNKNQAEKLQSDRNQQANSDYYSLSESVTPDCPIEVRTSFRPTFNASVQVGIETSVRRTALENVESTCKTRARSSSVTSVRSSISSVKSISSYVKSIYSMDAKPSMYQKLVIPFSGFTEDDVKEIRGGKEPVISGSHTGTSKISTMNASTSTKRPVLKKYQSQKRKSSYERYIQENLTRFAPRNNTEDSSYNTVLAVKMLVEAGVGFDDPQLSNAILTVDETATTKTGTVSREDVAKLSERSSLLLAELMKPLEPTDSLTHNREAFVKLQQPESSRVPDKTTHQTVHLQEMELKRELELVNDEYERIQSEYEEAEKTYFEARLRLQKIRSRRNYLITQLNAIEKDYLYAAIRRKS